MLKEIFHDSFDNFEIYEDMYEKPWKSNWEAIQMLSAAIAIAAFEIYGWKFSGYLILICSFSFC